MELTVDNKLINKKNIQEKPVIESIASSGPFFYSVAHAMLMSFVQDRQSLSLGLGNLFLIAFA